MLPDTVLPACNQCDPEGSSQNADPVFYVDNGTGVTNVTNQNAYTQAEKSQITLEARWVFYEHHIKNDTILTVH
jgi:hypothetical protein